MQHDWRLRDFCTTVVSDVGFTVLGTLFDRCGLFGFHCMPRRTVPVRTVSCTVDQGRTTDDRDTGYDSFMDE